MIYNYKGHGVFDSKCDLFLNGNVVLVTELADNTGTSITNAAEGLATEICEKYKIKFKNLVWIEHYPDSGLYDETFDMVTFEVIGGRLYNPSWKRISKDKAYDLMGW